MLIHKTFFLRRVITMSRKQNSLQVEMVFHKDRNLDFVFLENIT